MPPLYLGTWVPEIKPEAKRCQTASCHGVGAFSYTADCLSPASKFLSTAINVLPAWLQANRMHLVNTLYFTQT